MANKNTKGSASFLDSVSPLIDRVRNVKPAAAKESASRTAVGTKDLVQLSIAYVKQETKQPLTGLAKFAGLGLVGAVFISTGMVLLLLAALRGIQTALAFERVKVRDGGAVADEGIFSGGLSFVPYLLTVVIAIAVVGFIGLRMRAALRTNTQGGK